MNRKSVHEFRLKAWPLQLELRILRKCSVNFFQDFAHAVAEFPVWIMRLELSHVADPPDVVADPVRFFVAPVYFFSADLFAHRDGFEH